KSSLGKYIMTTEKKKVIFKEIFSWQIYKDNEKVIVKYLILCINYSFRLSCGVREKLAFFYTALLTDIGNGGGAEAVSSCRGFLEGAIRRAEEEIIIWKFVADCLPKNECVWGDYNPPWVCFGRLPLVSNGS
ncbi:hypothetical protein ACJX0J_012997, partial [Zea mays]